MTTEQLHDALNLLDQDLITSADALRQRKVPTPSRLPRFALLAACLCVLLIASTVFRPLSSAPGAGTSTGAAPPASENEGSTPGVAVDSVDSGGALNGSSSTGDSLTSPSSPNNAGGKTPGSGEVQTGSTVAAANSLVVQVDRWLADGFRGTIISEEGDTLFRPGQELLVLFDEGTEIIVEEDFCFSYGNQSFDAESLNLPAGSLLMVEFTSVDFNETTHTYDRIYAGCVMPKDLYDSRK